MIKRLLRLSHYLTQLLLPLLLYQTHGRVLYDDLLYTPDILMTAPSGARFPFSTISGPSLRKGLSNGITTFCPS